jgi:signal peptidase I
VNDVSLVVRAAGLVALGLTAILLTAALGASGVDAAGDAIGLIGIGSMGGLGTSQLYRVPSGSMEPTLPIGTRVAVKEGPPAMEAIAVFHPPEGSELEECGPKHYVLRPGGAACDAPTPKESKVLEYIKRIVAGPGDEIYIRRGHVYRKANGSHKFVRERDPYIHACGVGPECDLPVPIKIPAGHWFLMGDNRGESDDSRFWGPVPRTWIVGMATYLECPRFNNHGIAWVRRSWQQGCAVHA